MSLSLSPAQAAQTILERRGARDRLIPFTTYTYPAYVETALHARIAAALERVEQGTCDRLMLLLPPRHGKSELASRRFGAWYLGRQPDRSLIAASASATLAEGYGRDVRNIINSHAYAALFDTRISEDSKAKGRWHTNTDGQYYAVGVGGDVMGRGGDVFLIDDPFANMADAQSALKRERVWEWYTGTAYNRLEPGGAIILINHRMHEDDLSGRILAQQAAGGDRFEVIEFPAISDAGHALCPERYTLDELQRIRANTLPRFWSALYQQRPAPEDGDYFKSDWLRSYAEVPARDTLRVYGGSDYAVTRDGGDYTAHVVIGLDPRGRIYLLDVWRGRTDSSVWIEAFCDLVEKWAPIGWAEERGQIRSGVGPFLTRRMRERCTFVHREGFPARGDKSIRAQSIRGRMALDGLYVPVHAGWYADFETELLTFPMGKHDDQVDALGLVGQLLDKMTARTARPATKPDVDRWDRLFAKRDTEDMSWKAF